MLIVSKMRQALPLLALLGVLQVADVVTTNLVPHLEINPVTLYLFEHLGGIWWMPKAAICLAIAMGIGLSNSVPKRTLAVVTSVYAIIVLVNIINVADIYG